MKDADELDGLIATFVDYERPEVRDFRTAIKAFRDDIPHILEALRAEIKKTARENDRFRERRNSFLDVCRQSINPEIEIFDIHEMLIQHILTEDIFTNIFHESQFHRENNIAREISEIIATFFTGATRKNTLKSIEHYYAVIRRKSENIANHHEKQKFLKAVYENFYKAYNPKAADRLGIVYTPNEIVRFMIESADYLTHKHFGKLLSDPGVEILDPCTDTGTGASHFREKMIRGRIEGSPRRRLVMTPQDQERLEACSAEMAEILYRNSDPEGLESLDGIEQTVRQQMLAEVSPRVDLFLSTNKRLRPEDVAAD